MKVLLDSNARKFADSVGKVFKQAPDLPKEWVEFLVKISPWVVGLVGVMSVVMVISLMRAILGVGWYVAKISGMSAMGVGGGYLWPQMVMTGVMGWLYLKAFKPLQARKRDGWMYVFWGDMVGVVSLGWGILFGVMGGMVGSVLGTILGLYLLFQVRSAFIK